MGPELDLNPFKNCLIVLSQHVLSKLLYEASPISLLVIIYNMALWSFLEMALPSLVLALWSFTYKPIRNCSKELFGNKRTLVNMTLRDPHTLYER